MRHTLWLVAAMFGSALSLSASSFSFAGNLPADDSVQYFLVSLDAPQTFTAKTLSFAGGTNAAGDTIVAGGFAPVLSLFEASGAQTLLALDSAGGPGPGSGARPTDPGSGFCWDSYISISLGAGSYILALSEDDNLPLGPTLADGFLRSGQGNFTGPEFLGSEGAFVLVTGDQRTSNWAVDIQADSATTTPEPCSVLLCAPGFIAAAVVRRRR